MHYPDHMTRNVGCKDALGVHRVRDGERVSPGLRIRSRITARCVRAQASATERCRPWTNDWSERMQDGEAEVFGD